MLNNKTILIIAAMEEEMQHLLSKLDSPRQIEHLHTDVYQATYKGKNIILARCMIGKVNAAIITTELVNQYQPELVINIGTSGAINNDLNVGDIVIGEKLFYGDVDVTPFGYDYGQVPAMPTVFEPIKENKHVLDLHLDKFDFKVQYGNICTTDTFITKEKVMTFIDNSINKIDVMEMEAAAIAQVCHLKQLNCFILRSVSDQVFGEANEKQFKETIDMVSKNCATVCLEAINAY